MILMPRLLQWLLPTTTRAIVLPPFGIYVRPGREHDPGLAEHEAVHWAQYQRMGLWSFYWTYIWQLARYGYADHPMEIEAREKSGVA